MTMSTRVLMECKKQHRSKQVDNNKEDIILVFKNGKVTTTTTGAKLIGIKLLIVLTKIALDKYR